MVDRLTVEDASFLYLEDTTTPMHVGGVAIFRESEAGFDYDRLVKLIRDRIALAPRYRQKIKEVPGNMGAPVWVDDSNFDVTFHVRRSALPRPGTDAQLRELVARIMARPLDRNRPMWEMYLVEGLKGRRFDILTKSHHAIVDGIMTVDIGQVILDDAPIAELEGTQVWRPTREPSQVELLVGAAAEQLRSPAGALGSVKRGVHDVTSTVTGIGRSMMGLMSAAVSVARSPIHGPLNFELSEQRRFAMASLKLSDFKAIRTAHGGTVNDDRTTEEYIAFIERTLDNALAVSRPDVHIFYWCDQSKIWIIQTTYNKLGITNRRVCVWIKNGHNATPLVAFNKCYEPCVYGTKGKPDIEADLQNLTEVLNKEIGNGNNLMHTLDVWPVKRLAGKDYEHATSKPPTVYEKAFKRCSKPGDIILDSFCGSGSSLIAAHQLNRRLYGVELEPQFCDVIIRRFEKLTGIKVRVIRDEETS